MTYYFLKLLENRQFFYINHRKRKVYPDYRRYIPVCFAYIQYLKKIQKTGMVFEYYDEDLRRHVKKGEYFSRYHQRYIAGIYARFKRLEEWAAAEFDGYLTLMTLTISQRGLTVGVALDELAKSKAALIMNLRNIRRKIGYLEYIWVIEPHKSGYPHCHFILFTKEEFKSVFEHRLKNLWSKKYGAGSYNWGLDLGSDEGGEKNSQQIEYLAQYLLEYVGKTMGGVYGAFINPAYLIFHAEIWAKYKPAKATDEKSIQGDVSRCSDGSYRVDFNSRGAYRLWDCSRGLKEIMKREKPQNEGINYTSVMVQNHTADPKAAELGAGLSQTYEKGNLDLIRAIVKRKKSEAIAFYEL